MTNVEDEFMAVDPEMERIWREDDEPSLNEVRASLPVDEDDEEIELEQPEDTADTEDSNDEEEVESEEVEESERDEPEAKDDKPVSYKVRANNMDLDLTVEELQKLAPKALDYTKKMQEIAPWRKSISALKDNGLTEHDVNLMIDVMKGDKTAIEEVLRRTKVDPLDVDTDSKEVYVPKQYGRDETVMAIEEIVEQISNDAEYKITEQVVDREWDSRSRQTMAQDPNMIMGLHNDIKNGIYDKVAPIAFKMKAMDGGRLSDLDYYIEAGRQLFSNPQNTEVREVVQENKRQTEIKEMASRRKAASPTKSTSGKRDVIDYLNDNDEDYEDWYKRTINSR